MSTPWLSISALVTKSALNKPATRLYPFEQREPYAKTRGHVLFRVDNCTFCGICSHKCPTGAIVIDKKGQRWAIDHTLCILCGCCVEECREGCITQSTQPRAPLLRADVAQFREEYRAAPRPRVKEDAPG
ncbi:4Fe-4S binding protein [Thiococcus pfennigii]|uniref:4Fe-4S binding protein n=1 Tax=Thiococcus pfennigii TaxID=1057 RepID=UPI001904377F|nr:4Fe-4S binding protein [Thiococcus pfennigii]MBK1702194.1 4Fe-4S ferredoxin [Thiococcus pfennigii]MBK1733539.1 4Fe-4S ferredoxin [Thiococcus pfennigii]